MRLLFASVVAVCVSAGASGASVLSNLYSGLLFFGDSLTDTGNLAPFPPPPYFANQFSNGPVWSDILDDDFAASATRNYAFGSARATGGGLVPNLNGQINLYSIDRFFPPVPQTGANPLASLWFGANDMFGVLESVGAGLAGGDATARAAADTAIGAAASAIRSGITRLADDFGIRDFLVLNLPDLGATPRYNSGGLASAARTLTEDFNAGLALELSGITTPGVTITTIDIFSIFDGVIAGSILPDLDNVEDRCLTYFFISPNVCPTPDSYLFWDDVHPTRVVHAELARQVEAAFAPIPLPAGLPLLAGGLLVLGWAGRRQMISSSSKS